MGPIFNRVLAALGVVGVAAIGGVAAGLNGVDWVGSFGPTLGAMAAAGAAYAVKESIPKLQAYIKRKTERA